MRRHYTGASSLSQPEDKKATAVIIGRPNVGKSTLFNRLIGDRIALVEEEPGTTRDRLQAEVEWDGRSFLLVDTGGLDVSEPSGYAPLVRRQVETAMAEADVLLLLVDAVTGPTALDYEVANLLRGVDKPLLLIANKADNEARRAAAVQFYELGLGEPIPISAYHDLGVQEMMGRLAALLPVTTAAVPTAALSIAIIGRPNVGKSTLLNAIVGEERVIVSPEPGTTRDAVDTWFEYRGERLVIIDTGGIRRPGRVAEAVEKHSILRARRALERAEVAILVLDAHEGIIAQDTHIAGYVVEACKGLVVAVNKWDLVPREEALKKSYAHYVATRLRFTPWASVEFVAAKEGWGVRTLLDAALAAGAERRRRIATAEVNTVVRRAVGEHTASRRGQQVKVLYATQATVNPPTFVFFVNDPKLVHFSYRRYLENALRRAFGFEGTALRLVFKGRGEGRD